MTDELSCSLGVECDLTMSSTSGGGGKITAELEVARQTQEILALKKALQQQEQKNERLRKSKAELTTALALSTKRSKKISEENNKFMEDYRSRITQQNVGMAASRQQDEDEITRLRAELESLRAEHNSVFHANHELQFQRTLHDEHMKDNTKLVEDLDAKIGEKEAQVIALSQNLQFQASQIDELTAVKTEVSDKLKSLLESKLVESDGKNKLTADGACIDYTWVQTRLDYQWMALAEQRRATEAVYRAHRALLQDMQVSSETNGKIDTVAVQRTLSKLVHEFGDVVAAGQSAQEQLEKDRAGLDAEQKAKVKETASKDKVMAFMSGKLSKRQEGALVTKAFAVWNNYKTARQRARSYLMRLAMRDQRHRLQLSFGIWKGKIQAELHAEETNALRSELAAGKAAVKERLKSAFASRFAQSDKQLLTTSFDKWRVWKNNERAKKTMVINRLVDGLTGGLLRGTYKKWEMHIRDAKYDRLKRKLKEERRAADIRLAGVQVKYVELARKARRKYQLMDMFYRWRMVYLGNKATLQSHLMVRRTRQGYQKQIFFRKWRALYKKRQTLGRFFRKLEQRQRTSSLKSSFEYWFLSSQKLQYTQLIAKQKEASLAAIMRRWRQGSLSAAFHSWHDTAHASAKRKKDLTTKMLHRMVNQNLFTCWRQWTWYIEHEQLIALKANLNKQKEATGAALIKKWRLGSLIPVFKEWRKNAAELRQHRYRVTDRTIRRLYYSGVWRCLRTWKQHVENAKVDDLKSSFMKENERLQAMLDRQKANAARNAINKFRASTITRCFHNWQNYAHQSRQKKRDVVTRSLSRMQHAREWNTWRTWVKLCEEGRIADVQAMFQKSNDDLKAKMLAQKETATKSIINRWRLSSLHEAFSNWTHFVEARKKNKHDLINKISRRLYNQNQYLAWRQWRLHVEELSIQEANSRWAAKEKENEELREKMMKQKEQAAASIIRRWRLGAVTPAFKKWHEYTIHAKERRLKLTKSMLLRLCNREIFICWRKWKSTVENIVVAELTAKMNSADHKAKVMKWRANNLHPAFWKWKMYTKQSRQHKFELMTRMIQRMVNGNIWTAWRSWQSNIEHAKVREMREQLNSEKSHHANAMITKWRLKTFVNCFHKWVAFKDASLQHKHTVLERTAKRLVNSSIWTSWRAWTIAVEDARINALKGRLEAENAKLRRNMERQKAQAGAALIRRWQAGTLTKAFQRWDKWTQERRVHKKNLLTVTLKRMYHGNAFTAYRQWKNYVENLRVTELQNALNAQGGALAAQKAKRANDLIMKWKLRSLLPAFEHWKMFTAESKEYKRHTILKTCRRMQNSKIWGAWRVWSKSVEDSQLQEITDKLQSNLNAQTAQLIEQKQKRVQAMINRWRLKALIPAFEKWHSWSDAQKQHKKTLMTNSLNRLMNGNLWTAWRQWHMYMEQQQIADLQARFDAEHGHLAEQKKKRVQAMIKRWRLQAMIPCFEKLRAFAAHNKQRKFQLMTITLNRLSQGNLWSVWRQWGHYVEQDKVNEIQEMMARGHDALVNQKQHRAQELISKWRMRALVPCFNTWKHWAEAQRERKTVLFRSTVLRMANASLFRAWRSWTLYVEEDKMEEMKQQWALTRRMSFDNKMKDAQANYDAAAAASAAHSAKLERMLEMEKERAARAIMEKTMKRMVNHAIWATWRQWTGLVEAEQVAEMQNVINSQKHKRAAEMISKWRLRALVPCFNALKTHARERVARKKVLFSSTLHKLINSSIWRAYRTWTQYMYDERRDEAIKQELMVRRMSFDNKMNAAQHEFLQQQAQMATSQAQLEAQMQEMKAEAERKQKEHEFNLMNRLLHRMCNHGIWRAWRGWNGHIEAEKKREHEYRLMDRSLRRMINHRVYAPWRRWLTHVDDQRMEEIRAARWAQRKASFDGHMNAMRSEYDSKIQNLEEYQRQKDRSLISKCIHRMANQRIWRAWRNWTNIVEEEKMEEMKQEWAMTRRMSFDNKMKEMEMSYEEKNQALAAQMAEERRIHNKKLMGRCLTRLINASLWRTWRSWYGMVEEHRVESLKRKFQQQMEEQGAMYKGQLDAQGRMLDEQGRVMKTQVSKGSMAQQKLIERFAKHRAQRNDQTIILSHFFSWRVVILQDKIRHALAMVVTARTKTKTLEKSVKDQLTYRKQVQELRAKLERNDKMLHESSLLEKKYRSLEKSVRAKQQVSSRGKEQRAQFFRVNFVMCSAFRRWFEYSQTSKLRQKTISHLIAHRRITILRQAQFQWRLHMGVASSSAATQLDEARREIDMLLHRMQGLEYKLRNQSQAENAEVNSLNRKIDLLVTEVKERGSHIHYLIEENNRISGNVSRSQRSSPVKDRPAYQPRSDDRRDGLSLSALLAPEKGNSRILNDRPTSLSRTYVDPRSRAAINPHVNTSRLEQSMRRSLNSPSMVMDKKTGEKWPSAAKFFGWKDDDRK